MKKRMILFIAAILLLATAGSAFSAGSVKPDQLRFMAGPPGGNWFALGGALAELWSSKGMPHHEHHRRCRSQYYQHTQQKGEFGFSNTSMVAVGQKASDAPFKTPTDNIDHGKPVHPLHLFHRPERLR